MTELYWPFGLAALHDDQLAASVWAASAGVVLVGRVLLAAGDRGLRGLRPTSAGASRAPTRSASPRRRNRHGLSFVRADGARRLRQAPAAAPGARAVRRCGWTGSRCAASSTTAPSPSTCAWSRREDVAQAVGPRRTRAGAEAVHGHRRRTPLRGRRGAPGRRTACGGLELQCAFAVLPVARSQARERWRRTKARAARLAKESPLGAPLRLAKRPRPRRVAGRGRPRARTYFTARSATRSSRASRDVQQSRAGLGARRDVLGDLVEAGAGVGDGEVLHPEPAASPHAEVVERAAAPRRPRRSASGRGRPARSTRGTRGTMMRR